jgi:hypothetical protein
MDDDVRSPTGRQKAAIVIMVIVECGKDEVVY